MGRVAIMHTDHLKPIDVNLLIVQLANTSGDQWAVILGASVKLFVIPGDVEDAKTRTRWPVRTLRSPRRVACAVGGRVGDRAPWLCELLEVSRGPVIQVSGQKNDVRSEVLQLAHKPANEPSVADVAKMHVADQGRHASTPAQGKFGKRNTDSRDAQFR